MDVLAAKCGRIATALRSGSPAADIGRYLEGMPTSPETFETVARFCEGREPSLRAENVVPLACLASFLDMSESLSRNNLLRRCLAFIERKVLPNWNDTVMAFRSSEHVIREASRAGILGACVDSLVSKALSDPKMLLQHSDFDDDEEEGDEEMSLSGSSLVSARRRLFVIGWKTEDITALPLQLYEPLVSEMLRRGVSSSHVAASLRRYAKKWAFVNGEEVSAYERNSRREVVEAVERLLPEEINNGYEVVRFGFEMLRCANDLEASVECRESLESRVGRELHRATVDDISTAVILNGGGGCDVDCLRRILKQFYGNYASEEEAGLERVAELVEEFLGGLAGGEVDLKTFSEVADIVAGVSRETHRISDGVYKGVDLYLNRHREMSESEREEVCRAVDFERLSPEACDHAAKNERLPMRAVVQVLFAFQLQLRDSIVAAQSSHYYGEEEQEEVGLLASGGGDDEEVKVMSDKLGELEKECVAMKREIVAGKGDTRVAAVKKEKVKVSLWKEMKRKFGCVTSSVTDCNCQVKKKKMRMKRN